MKELQEKGIEAYVNQPTKDKANSIYTHFIYDAVNEMAESIMREMGMSSGCIMHDDIVSESHMRAIETLESLRTNSMNYSCILQYGLSLRFIIENHLQNIIAESNRYVLINDLPAAI